MTKAGLREMGDITEDIPTLNVNQVSTLPGSKCLEESGYRDIRIE